MRLCNNAVFAVMIASAACAQPAQTTPLQRMLLPVIVVKQGEIPATGLGAKDFEVFEEGKPQLIDSLTRDDVPASIGIVLDLSGSMASKLTQARGAIEDFMKVANPRDEYFVIGFNNKPELIEDFTNSAADIEAKLATVQAEHKTALYDAIDLGLSKMQSAHNERKALLVITDGGDNASKTTREKLESRAQSVDVEIYSISIFDPYAPTPEERISPLVLHEVGELTGGRFFGVGDIDKMGKIAERISIELRTQYLIGYRPGDLPRDGKWRKVKVKVNPPPGLPPLTVYARTGYYAPLQ